MSSAPSASIGLGTMGAGIAEVFARNGFSVVGVELNEEALARGRQHLEHSTARAVKRGKLSEAEQAELLGRITLTTRDEGPRRRRLRRRGRRRVARGQEGHLPRARRDRRARHRARDQHLLAVGHRDLDRQRPAGPRHRRALLQPGAGAEPRRDRPHRRHRAVGARRREGARGAARQEPRRLRRQGRLHRQHAAVRLPQPRGRDVRGPLRLPRGHRRRDALRLRLPDGPAGAARPDRPRHGVRDPRHDVQAGPRPAARAGAAAQAVRHRRPARPQDRSWLLHLRGARQPGRRRRRRDAPARTTSRGCATTSGSSAWSAPAPWPAASSRSSPRPGTTCCSSVARQAKVDGVRRHHRALPRQGDPARQATRRPRPRCSAALRGTTSLDDLRDVDLVVEAIAEDLAGQDHAVREPRRDLQARGDPGHHDLVACRSSRWPRRPSARRTSSACTSSTPRR